MKQHPEIDLYINEKPDFSRPILTKLRSLIFQASGNIEETMKWRNPCYSQNGLVCAMAAFKQHVNFSFFSGKQITDTHQLFEPSDNQTLAALKFYTLGEMHADEVLIGYIQQAIKLNLENKTNHSKRKASKKDKVDLVIPNMLQQALDNNLTAKKHFEQFSYSKQKDYIEWIGTAKREDTQLKRLTTAIEWISEGKSRHWKYENC